MLSITTYYNNQIAACGDKRELVEWFKNLIEKEDIFVAVSRLVVNVSTMDTSAAAQPKQDISKCSKCGAVYYNATRRTCEAKVDAGDGLYTFCWGKLVSV